MSQNFPSTPIRIQLPGVTLTVPSSIVASQLVNSHSLVSSQISQDSTISESSSQEDSSTGISLQRAEVTGGITLLVMLFKSVLNVKGIPDPRLCGSFTIWSRNFFFLHSTSFIVKILTPCYRSVFLWEYDRQLPKLLL